MFPKKLYEKSLWGLDIAQPRATFFFSPQINFQFAILLAEKQKSQIRNALGNLVDWGWGSIQLRSHLANAFYSHVTKWKNLEMQQSWFLTECFTIYPWVFSPTKGSDIPFSVLYYCTHLKWKSNFKIFCRRKVRNKLHKNDSSVIYLMIGVHFFILLGFYNCKIDCRHTKKENILYVFLRKKVLKQQPLTCCFFFFTASSDSSSSPQTTPHTTCSFFLECMVRLLFPLRDATTSLSLLTLLVSFCGSKIYNKKNKYIQYRSKIF